MARRPAPPAWARLLAFTVIIAAIVVVGLAARPSTPGPTGAAPTATPTSTSPVVVPASAAGATTRPASTRGLPTTGAATTPAKTASDPSPAAAIDPESGLPTIRRASLPSEARVTLSLIGAGGPFPYAQDGSTYRNLERILPGRATGYYHEYTVETPGSADRGARRIVTGRPGEWYWTADHYASFRRIVP